jgi:hypothetical protein
MGFRLIEIRQPVPNRHPCTLVLETAQAVTRVRRGAELRWLDGPAQGRVESVRTGRAGQMIAEVLLQTGVRDGDRPQHGSSSDWSDSKPFDPSFLRRKALDAAAASGSFAVTGDPLPPATPRPLPAGDLLDVADRLKARGS